MSKGSKASADMIQSLKDMQTVLADTKALFEGAFGSAGKAAKEFDAWNNSLEDTVDNIELTVDGFKTMAREGKKLARLSSDQLKDTAQVKKALQEQLKALAAIHRSNVLNKEDSAKSEEMMRAIGKALRGVRDGAADLGDLVGEVAERSREASKRVSEISFEAPIAGASKLGEAFNIALKGMSKLDDFGFKGMFGRISAMRENVAKMREDLQKTGKVSLEKAKFSKQDSENLMSGKHSERKNALGSIAEQFARKKDSEQALSLKAMSGRTGMTGTFDRFLTKKALGAVGSTGGGIGGMVGRGLGGLMSAGGGASVMGGMGAVMGRMMGPISAVTTVLQVIGKGFERNKDIYDKLGGGGMIAGQNPEDLKGTYSSWSSALTPELKSGEALRFGASFEKSADIIKEIANSGISIQGMQLGHEASGVGGALSGGRATDMFSGIMRNAYMFSKPLGMSETEGAAQTMKFIKDFSLEIGETEDMFKKMNKAVKITGMSTTAYLNLLSDVTSGFDKMNKALGFTTNLINILGKGAKYTNDDLRDMVKGLLGQKKDLPIGTFSFQTMSKQERQDVIDQKQRTADTSGAELAKKLKIGNVNQYTRDQLKQMGTGQDVSTNALITRHIADRQAAEAFNATKGDPMRMQAAQLQVGGPEGQIAQNLSLLRTAVKEANGNLADFAGTSHDASKRQGKIQNNPVYGQVAQTLGIDSSAMAHALTKGFGQYIEEARTAMGTGDEATTARGRLGISDADYAKMKKESEQTGGDIADTPTMQKLLNSVTSFSKVSKAIAEEQKGQAEALAKENQLYITKPLDYIQRYLESVSSNMINVVQKLSGILIHLKAKDPGQELREAKQMGTGFANGEETLKSVEADEKKMVAGAGSPAAKEAMQKYADSMKDIIKQAETKGLTKEGLVKAQSDYAAYQETAQLLNDKKKDEKGKWVPKTQEEKDKDSAEYRGRAEGMATGFKGTKTGSSEWVGAYMANLMHTDRSDITREGLGLDTAARKLLDQTGATGVKTPRAAGDSAPKETESAVLKLAREAKIESDKGDVPLLEQSKKQHKEVKLSQEKQQAALDSISESTNKLANPEVPPVLEPPPITPKQTQGRGVVAPPTADLPTIPSVPPPQYADIMSAYRAGDHNYSVGFEVRSKGVDPTFCFNSGEASRVPGAWGVPKRVPKR